MKCEESALNNSEKTDDGFVGDLPYHSVLFQNW